MADGFGIQISGKLADGESIFRLGVGEEAEGIVLGGVAKAGGAVVGVGAAVGIAALGADGRTLTGDFNVFLIVFPLIAAASIRPVMWGTLNIFLESAEGSLS